MRIAIFGESYLPHLSGVTVSTETLARGLAARGHEVLLVVPRPARGRNPGSAGMPGPEPRYAWLPSYQLPRIAPLGYRMPLPLPWATALATVDRFRPNIVHAQSPFVSGQLARRAARRARAPLVFTHHTRFADYRHYLGPLAGPGAALTDAYLRRFSAACAAVIAPSRDLAAEIRAERVEVIPTGVDVAGIAGREPMNPRPVAGWPQDAIVAVTMGRLAVEKSVGVVLEAVALAAANDERLRLLVIGDGPAAPTLRERAERLDLAGRVWFTGLLGHREALASVAGCDLFVFASLTDTQGLVLAEALACAVPVVARRGPGIADSVRSGIDGMIVHDARALADAIVFLVADGERRREMAEAAREGAVRFDLGTRIGQVEALYRDLLDRSRGR
jgi:glycosyltransferase involved in cell wall biosynthesis